MAEVDDTARAVETVWGELLSAQHWADGSFVRLPLIYPSGSPVTVKVAPSGVGSFKVSDAGFAYRELESFGGQRSFAKTADAILGEWDVSRDRRCIFAGVDMDELARGISDVAAASWQVVDRIYSRVKEDGEDEIKDYLTDRLVEIFGRPSVYTEVVLVGASTSKWEITALVSVDGKKTAFQVVSAHPNSIYRTNTAFDDLAALDNPPSLVAVVESTSALGAKLTLLSRHSYVIETNQPDADYRRVAA